MNFLFYLFTVSDLKNHKLSFNCFCTFSIGFWITFHNKLFSETHIRFCKVRSSMAFHFHCIFFSYRFTWIRYFGDIVWIQYALVWVFLLLFIFICLFELVWNSIAQFVSFVVEFWARLDFFWTRSESVWLLRNRWKINEFILNRLFLSLFYFIFYFIRFYCWSFQFVKFLARIFNR